MKRMVLVLVGLVVFTASAQAQTVPEVIELVVGQSLPRFPGEATLIKWNADYTYETLREGSNTLVCYDCADERDRALFSAQCTSLANLDRVAQNRRFHAESTDADGERALVAGAAADGTRVKPEFGSFFRSVNGADQASAGLHMTIAMPMATTASTGFPEGRDQGGAFIIAAGTSEAHLMTP